MLGRVFGKDEAVVRFHYLAPVYAQVGSVGMTLPCHGSRPGSIPGTRAILIVKRITCDALRDHIENLWEA